MKIVFSVYYKGDIWFSQLTIISILVYINIATFNWYTTEIRGYLFLNIKQSFVEDLFHITKVKVFMDI